MILQTLSIVSIFNAEQKVRPFLFTLENFIDLERLVNLAILQKFSWQNWSLMENLHHIYHLFITGECLFVCIFFLDGFYSFSINFQLFPISIC